MTDGCMVKGQEVEHGWLEEPLTGKLLAAFPPLTWIELVSRASGGLEPEIGI